MKRELIFGLFAAGLACSACGEDFGRFVSNPQLEWDPDGRTMLLLRDLQYVDPKQQTWTAPVGGRVDGASIPRVFWSLVGGPYEGKYRNASVVHDTECTPPYKHDWRDVHRMFYFGTRAGGIDEFQAKVMYAAVYHFGPRWEWNKAPAQASSVASRDDALRMRALLRREPSLSLDAIDGLSHSGLVAQVPDSELAIERKCQEARDRMTSRYRMDGSSLRGSEIEDPFTRQREDNMNSFCRNWID